MCMTLAQLTHREILCDIECCLQAMKDKLYHIGIRGRISRNILADATESEYRKQITNGRIQLKLFDI